MNEETSDGRLEVFNEMKQEDWQVISTNLRNFNIEQSGGLSIKPEVSTNLTLKTDDGEVVGGLRSRAIYQCLTIDHIWVNEQFRKIGYGRSLLWIAERLARKEGCISANTSTYSFQAHGFYEKYGYKTVGVFEEYPNDIKKFFLEKKL
jgi:GNAT superfamily N-acetyltransferase